MQDEDFTEDTGRPSKTKQKEDMHELRDLGAELVELSEAGHTAAGDDNDAFTDVVVRFVGS